MKQFRGMTIAAIVIVWVLAAAQAAADDMLGVYKLAIDNDPQFKGPPTNARPCKRASIRLMPGCSRKSTGRDLRQDWPGRRGNVEHCVPTRQGPLRQ